MYSISYLHVYFFFIRGNESEETERNFFYGGNKLLLTFYAHIKFDMRIYYVSLE